MVLSAREHLTDLRRLRDQLDGPPGGGAIDLFIDAEDHPEYDDDAGVNFHMGFLTGAAEASGLPLDAFLATVERAPPNPDISD